MPDEPSQTVLSIPPGGPLPAWPVSWANVWADQLGGLHWTRYSHGTTFETAFLRTYGRVLDRDEWTWMHAEVGSVGDAEEEDDNPGWQFNELATGSLGWVRIKATDLQHLEPRFTISFGETASRQAIQATVRLLSAHPAQSKVEVAACDGFPEETTRGKAIIELREWAAEASLGLKTAPVHLHVHVPKPVKRP
jgi:hypothetical protein